MTRKLAVIGLLLAWIPGFLHAVTKNKEFKVNDFSKGLDSYHNPTTLPDGFVQDSLNVLFDDIAPGTKRTGYTTAWSTTTGFAFTGLWTYTDQSNTTWQLARSSTQITASNLAGSVVVVATVSASNFVGETNAFGRSYFVDQTQGLYYWNGTSTTYVTGGPRGSIITQFHNRLWVTGAAVPNGNQLYGSAYYDGNTWATGLNPTDPVQYSIGLQDNFDNVTAIYVYLDTLYLFKHYSIFALYGFDQTNFQISQLTQECGCIDGGSIQTYNGGLKFVSLRGVESFNGYACTRISDPVKNKVDPAIQLGGFSQQSWIQQNSTDWNAGTFVTNGPLPATSANIASPALALSTNVVTDTNFGAGTAGAGITTSQVAGSFALLTELHDTFSTFGNWTGTSSGFYPSNNMTASGNTARNSSAGAGSAARSASSIVTINDFFAQATFSSGSGQTDKLCIINGSDQGYCLRHTNSGSAIQKNTDVLDPNSGTTICSGTLGTASDTVTMVRTSTGGFALYEHGLLSCSGSETTYTSFTKAALIIDDGSGNSTISNVFITPSSGSFTSVFNDSSFFSPAWGQVNATSAGSGSYQWFAKTSAVSGSGYTSQVLISTGTTYSGVANNRYLIYVATVTPTPALTTVPSVSAVSMAMIASTGAFKSQIHNMGSMNSWGNFTVSQALNGGAIAFSVCSSTNSNMGAPLSCANQTINSQITAATGTYVQWFATFSVTAATQTPALNSATVSWFTGSNAIPMSSTVWDNRYWLSLTTSTADTANDAVLVLNSRGAWTVFDIHAGAFTQYKNSLYHADSLASGNIYLDNQAYADNGNAIRAYVNTRNEVLGSIAADDYLYVIYPSAANTGSCAMSVQYSLDSSTTTFALGSPLLSEYGSSSAIRLPFPVDAGHQDFGQSVDFTVGTNDALCGWQFYGLMGLYKSRPIQ